MKRRARRKTMRCWPRQSANQPAIGFPTIPPKGSTVIGGFFSLELAFTVLISFYVLWPAKTMPTPKGLMPSCLARIGRKGVTGAAAAKMRKKWPCVVGKCSKYWIIDLWNTLCYPINVMQCTLHKKVTYITFTGRRSWFRPNPILFRLGFFGINASDLKEICSSLTSQNPRACLPTCLAALQANQGNLVNFRLIRLQVWVWASYCEQFQFLLPLLLWHLWPVANDQAPPHISRSNHHVLPSSKI